MSNLPDNLRDIAEWLGHSANLEHDPEMRRTLDTDAEVCRKAASTIEEQWETIHQYREEKKKPTVTNFEMFLIISGGSVWAFLILWIIGNLIGIDGNYSDGGPRY